MTAKQVLAVQQIENVRNRLRDMVRGDEYVDIGTLLYSLNEFLPDIGGKSIELVPSDIRSRFFLEVE